MWSKKYSDTHHQPLKEVLSPFLVYIQVYHILSIIRYQKYQQNVLITPHHQPLKEVLSPFLVYIQVHQYKYKNKKVPKVPTNSIKHQKVPITTHHQTLKEVLSPFLVYIQVHYISFQVQSSFITKYKKVTKVPISSIKHQPLKEVFSPFLVHIQVIILLHTR